MIKVKTTLRPECPNCFPESEYCPTCGEKRFDRKELSLKKLVAGLTEEFADLDSKLIKTLYLLTFRPGFLTLEFSRGVRVPYIKPLRLFIVIAVVNFLAFGLSPSTDIYTFDTVRLLDRFHFVDKLRNSGFLHDHYTSEIDEQLISRNIKDVLSVAIYGVIFAMAAFFKLLFRNQEKYYSEHLVFFLHVVSAAFLRNFLLLPLLLISKPLGFFLFASINFIYMIVALRKCYSLSTAKALLTLVPTIIVVLTLMTATLVMSTLIVLWK